MNTRSVSRNAFSNLHALAGFVVFAAFGVSCLPDAAMAQLTFNNVINNGGFETGSLSPCVITSVNPAPVVTTVQHHSGTRSALLGTVSGSEPFGNSSFYQQITVRAGGGTLSLLVAARDTEGAISQHARAPAHGRAASALPRLRQSEWLYS